jgi:hypothetical protein
MKTSKVESVLELKTINPMRRLMDRPASGNEMILLPWQLVFIQTVISLRGLNQTTIPTPQQVAQLKK